MNETIKNKINEKNKKKKKNNEKKKKNNENLKSLYLKRSDKKIADIKIADDFFTRLIGLMFRKNSKYPLLFEIPQKINRKERSSIHSLFMRFELKLVFIDEENKIFEIADLKPWSYYVPEKSAKYVVEFDKNKLDGVDLKIGDEIIIEK